MLVFYEKCLQTVSLPDGKMISELMSPQADNGKSAWPYAWFATHYLVGGNSIFYTMEGSDKSVYTIDIVQGNPKQLIADNKYTLKPQFLLGETLVVEALPTFDGTQVEYWGVDTLSGKRLWQYALKGEHDLRYHDARATSNGGIFVTQCRESPGKCTWADIDAKTGVGSNSGTASGGTFFDAAWYKDTFYLGNEGELMVINMLTGKLVYQWP